MVPLVSLCVVSLTALSSTEALKNEFEFKKVITTENSV